MANQYILRNVPENAELDNFYDPDNSKITIPLDKELTAVENAQKYYKKYAKEKTTIDMVTRQLEETRDEQSYLESILYNLENAVDVGTIEEIKNELSELGYVKKRKKPIKHQKSNPYHYKSSDGFEIYVGKNNNQNDFLTTKFAVASDIWMHTKNIPGSHVIIKSRNGFVSDTALIEGAKLAAYYSKAKTSANVPVDYTERKNVKKPSGAKPGMVIYFTNKTIYVTPDEKFINEMATI
jgi:predicted ribosome quality control (RQC) complex YloA/Tae2 family protein